MVFWALVDRKSLFHPLTVQMIGVYALQCVESSQEVFETTQIGRYLESLLLLHVIARSGIMPASPDLIPDRRAAHL